MPKPLLLVGENHHDLAGRQTLEKLLPELRALGYSRLCLEFLSTSTQSEILELLRAVIINLEQTITEAIQQTRFSGSKDDFINLPYEELIKHFKPVCLKPSHMALVIKNYQPSVAMFRICHTWITSGGTLHGINKEDRTDVTKMSGKQWDLHNALTLSHREKYMATHIKQHYAAQEDGTVALIGIGHLERFKAIVDNCLMIFPHASHWLGVEVSVDLQERCITVPATVYADVVDTEAQKTRFITRCKQKLTALTTVTSISATPTYTPLATAKSPPKPAAAKKEADDSFSFMRDAFKNGFKQ